MKPSVSITYCNRCGWLLRSGWLAQELLQTFDNDLLQVSLCPGDSGMFQIHVNDRLVWDRVADGGFPEVKVLKQRVRDVIDPERDLGHNDRGAKQKS